MLLPGMDEEPAAAAAAAEMGLCELGRVLQHHGMSYLAGPFIGGMFAFPHLLCR